jgi:hypothetical protein
LRAELSIKESYTGFRKLRTLTFTKCCRATLSKTSLKSSALQNLYIARKVKLLCKAELSIKEKIKLILQLLLNQNKVLE